MIVNVGLVVLSWILLRFEKKSLNVFGLTPVAKRLFQLALGLLLAAILSIFVNVLFAQTANFSWALNREYDSDRFFRALYSTWNSVLYEELIFRGYIFYRLVRLLGEHKGVIISSVAFGVYHWFSYEILGNYPMMIWIFLFTGLWGLMFAYSYTRTGTILIAIGLHWGWNFMDQIVFNRNGNGFLKPIVSDQTERLNQITGFLVTSVPAIIFALVAILYLTRTRNSQIPTYSP